jgi:hypothetical protein
MNAPRAVTIRPRAVNAKKLAKFFYGIAERPQRCQKLLAFGHEAVRNGQYTILLEWNRAQRRFWFEAGKLEAPKDRIGFKLRIKAIGNSRFGQGLKNAMNCSD